MEATKMEMKRKMWILPISLLIVMAVVVTLLSIQSSEVSLMQVIKNYETEIIKITVTELSNGQKRSFQQADLEFVQLIEIMQSTMMKELKNAELKVGGQFSINVIGATTTVPMLLTVSSCRIGGKIYKILTPETIDSICDFFEHVGWERLGANSP